MKANWLIHDILHLYLWNKRFLSNHLIYAVQSLSKREAGERLSEVSYTCLQNNEYIFCGYE